MFSEHSDRLLLGVYLRPGSAGLCTQCLNWEQTSTKLKGAAQSHQAPPP